MWKNKWKIIAYGGLLYFLSIGVPLYAQADSLALRGKDSLTYQIPISRERPESLRSFQGVPHSYDSSAFDYSETSGRNEGSPLTNVLLDPARSAEPPHSSGSTGAIALRSFPSSARRWDWPVPRPVP